MNALEASIRLEKLRRRANTLAHVVYYLDDEADFTNDIEVLRELHEQVESDYQNLHEKLRSVEL